MGRVFTKEQILADQIPGPADFEAALAGFSDAVALCIDQGAAVGSVVYGSVAAGRTTQRSDFDAIVMFRNHRSLALMDQINRQSYLSSDCRVPIHAVGYSVRTLERGNHETDRFFGHHVLKGTRIVQGEDIANVITLPTTPATDRMREYLHHKSYSLRKSIGAQGPERDMHRSVQRLLELPLAVGRKIVRVLDEIEGTDRATADSADKHRVSDLAVETFDELGSGSFPRAILEEDHRYDFVLANTVHGSYDMTRYEAYMHKLFRLIPQAAEWLDDVETAFVDRVGAD